MAVNEESGESYGTNYIVHRWIPLSNIQTCERHMQRGLESKDIIVQTYAIESFVRVFLALGTFYLHHFEGDIFALGARLFCTRTAHELKAA